MGDAVIQSSLRSLKITNQKYSIRISLRQDSRLNNTKGLANHMRGREKGFFLANH